MTKTTSKFNNTNLGGFTGGQGFPSWVTKNLDYTASAGDHVFADTSGSGFTVTLPASPALGDQVFLQDPNGGWQKNSVTLYSANATINNYSNSYFLSLPGYVEIIYNGTGWTLSVIPANFAAIGTGNLYVTNLNGDYGTVNVYSSIDYSLVTSISIPSVDPSDPADYPSSPYKMASTATSIYLTQLVYGGNVVVISRDTNEITATIGGFQQPRDIVILGTIAYVCDFDANQIVVIDTTQNQIINNINVANQPNEITFCDGYLYATCASSNSVAVINPTTNTVLTTITGFNYPYGIAGSNGNVYVANNGGTLGTTVSVINCSTNTVVANLNVPQGPQGVAAYNNTVYVASRNENGNGGYVTTINSLSNQVVTSFGSYDASDIDCFNGILYVSSYSGNQVNIYNTSNNSFITSINGVEPRGILVAQPNN